MPPEPALRKARSRDAQRSSQGTLDRSSAQAPHQTPQAVVKWMTTTLPEACNVLVAVRGGVVDVLAADVALRGKSAGTFAVVPGSPFHEASLRPGVHHQPLRSEFRRQLPWDAELGERRRAVACVAVPQLGPKAVLAVFYNPSSKRTVDQTLATLLAVAELNEIPDPAVYNVIRKAKREWERTVDALDEIVFLVDRRGIVRRANRTVERWGLCNVSVAPGRTSHEILHPACADPKCRLARLLSCRWKELRAKGSASFELTDEDLGRTLRITAQDIAHSRSAGDDVDANFGVIVISDVTQLHFTQRKLQQLNDDLERRVQARTQELEASNTELRAEIARRQVAEQKLEESRNELAQLSARLLDAQECERRRIALELHDSIGQSLGALKYSLERFVVVRRDPSLGDKERVLQSCIEQLQRAIHDTRSISMSLRPSLLDDMGAVSSVQWLCRWFGETYDGIHTHLECRVKDADIPEPLGTPIFRIVQEALNNVAKHAQARNVLVTLRRVDRTLCVEVLDDGVGFDASMPGRDTEPRLGIVGMRERATMSGGSFQIASGSDVSTTVRAAWELPLG
jgi:signal transduction histidine kinase